MSFIFRNKPKKIVTDGLIFHLDAGNVNSYPGSGSIWYDLSGKGNNGTLVNGVCYSNGNMIFDGQDDYINCGSGSDFSNITNKLTLAAWMKINIITSYPRIVGVDNCWILYIHDSSYKLSWFGSSVDHQFSLSPNLYDNKWHYVCATYNGNGVLGYVDSAYVGTLAKIGNLNSIGTTPVTIGNRVTLDRPFNGTISYVTIYNRALSDMQILQNYNATKNRYIYKD